MTRTWFSRAALLAGTALLLSGQALAQGAGSSGPGWFMPGQSSSGGASRAAHPAAPARAAPAASPTGAAEPGEPAPTGLEAGNEGPAPQQMQLPPPPAIPEVQRGPMPPAAVIGVLSIPDVLRASVAYREADKVIAERRQKLNEDAQKEQVALRDLGQQLASERSKLTAEQIRAKEKELQDRIAESRRKFSERGRIIQEASQFALAQIERTLGDVVQRVAASRGMNLVLQRAEVALNQAEFDITPEVADLLNKAIPSVTIPPEGVAPPMVAANAAATATAAADAAPKPAATAAQKPKPAAPQHR